MQTSRLDTLYYLDSNRKEKKIILTTINAIIQKTLPKKELKRNFIKISENSKLKIDKILSVLVKLGYERTSIVRDKSEFAVRGSIIDIFLPQLENPIRIDLFDDDIESIFEFDVITQTRISKSHLNNLSINHFLHNIINQNHYLNVKFIFLLVIILPWSSVKFLLKILIQKHAICFFHIKKKIMIIF